MKNLLPLAALSFLAACAPLAPNQQALQKSSPLLNLPPIAAVSTPAASASASPAPTQSTPAPTQQAAIPAPKKPAHLANQPDTPLAPRISSPSSIVIDAITGRVLFEKNADQQRGIASIQKLLTAITVIDAGNIDKKLTVSRSDQMTVPARVYISKGETYTRRYLLEALIIKSGNDVARALGRDHSGTYEAFSKAMTAKGKEIGMRDSVFQNPSGLTADGQYSSARDTAILARRAYRYPLIREAARTKGMIFSYTYGKTKELENTNELLTKVPYCTGFKTGTTAAAGRCLVSSGELNGRTTIVVVLGAKTPDALWEDSEKLLRWSLENNHL